MTVASRRSTYRTYVTPTGQVDSPSMARSTLSRDAARRRYVEIGELAALEQIRRDSEALDERALAVGPFARLDANAVAARDGKTRGAITNLFGSQAAFQAETMALALSAGDWIERVELPEPTALRCRRGLGRRAARRRVGARPAPRRRAGRELRHASGRCGSARCPYGLWSERVSAPSMDEHAQWVARLEAAFAGALEHFGVALRDDTTANDLACAMRQPGRGRLAQPVPHDAPPVPARRADRDGPAARGAAALAGCHTGPMTSTLQTAPAPPIDALDFLRLGDGLSDEERMIRDNVRAFVRERLIPRVGDWFEAGKLPRELAGELGGARRARHAPRGLRLRRGERDRVRARLPGARGGRLRAALVRLRAGLARDVRDLALRVGGAEAGVAAADGRGRGDRLLRADRARRRLGPRLDAHRRPSATATTGCSTAPRCGSRTAR